MPCPDAPVSISKLFSGRDAIPGAVLMASVRRQQESILLLGLRRPAAGDSAASGGAGRHPAGTLQD